MDPLKNLGKYSKSFITGIPADLNSKECVHYRKTILKYPEEGLYIYSFKEGRMLYADGWPEVNGWENDEINMLGIVSMSAEKFAPFVHEINDKALFFLHQKRKELEKYSFTIELKIIHKNGSEVPIKAGVSVHKTDKAGNLESIMGRFQVDKSLRFGKVMRYAAYGPEKNDFEEDLNKSLFSHFVISDKEKEALALAAYGYSFKQIADKLGVSQSAIEKRILPLYKRFGLKSLSHLVSFAYENYILP